MGQWGPDTTYFEADTTYYPPEPASVTTTYFTTTIPFTGYLEDITEASELSVLYTHFRATEETNAAYSTYASEASALGIVSSDNDYWDFDQSPTSLGASYASFYSNLPSDAKAYYTSMVAEELDFYRSDWFDGEIATGSFITMTFTEELPVPTTTSSTTQSTSKTSSTSKATTSSTASVKAVSTSGQATSTSPTSTSTSTSSAGAARETGALALAGLVAVGFLGVAAGL
ncbi:hypothetical protein MMC20_001762 [Loxospora ochrophaea]|nr:hypothetical protein [Loxospora ochrophaea]